MKIEHLPEHITYEMITEQFISLVEERYPSSEKTLQIPDRLGVDSIRGKIIILSFIRDAIKEVSPRMYHSIQHRDDIYTAIIEALTELEDELEELEEQEAQEEEEEESEGVE